MTKNLFKMNDGDMHRVADAVHKEFVRTGDRIIPYPDVLQVLKTMSGMKQFQPKELKPIDTMGQIR
ncbi:hypothetical protein, partial [Klebsiella pneumoniae]|uniref:hypothetical protein n=1 Tax=Klebsiella pneumoniae TaxID=573 RepID=UPI003B5C12D3